MNELKDYSLINVDLPNRHYAIDIFRMFLGALLFYKGFYFVENISEIYSMIGESIEISPFIIAHYVVVAHLLGGFLIAIGLLTRVAVLSQIPVLLGAVFYVHAIDVFLVTSAELEYSIVILMLLIVYLIYGSGKLSVDYLIIRQKEKRVKVQ